MPEIVLFFPKTGCSFHSFEPILSKRAKKKSPENPLVYWTFWRRVRDSNPRFLLGTQHFESFSQRVNFLSFRVSFRSSRLSQKPHKIRLFRPQSLITTAFFQSGFKSAFLPILERNQGRQERNHERRQYKIQYTAGRTSNRRNLFLRCIR